MIPAINSEELGCFEVHFMTITSRRIFQVLR